MQPDLLVNAFEWAEVYAASGITPGLPLVLTNKSIRPLLVWLDSTPSNDVDGAELWRMEPQRVSAGHSVVWVYMIAERDGDTARLNVQVAT